MKVTLYLDRYHPTDIEMRKLPIMATQYPYAKFGIDTRRFKIVVDIPSDVVLFGSVADSLVVEECEVMK